MQKSSEATGSTNTKINNLIVLFAKFNPLDPYIFNISNYLINKFDSFEKIVKFYVHLFGEYIDLTHKKSL